MTSSSKLEVLISFQADVELRFDDGSLAANSIVLSLFSSVLRGALEAHTAARDSSSSGSCNNSSNSPYVVPMEGFTKAEWLRAASFWYPVSDPSSISDCQDLELLLKVGSKFDLLPVLQKADSYLVHHASELKAPSDSTTGSSGGSSSSGSSSSTQGDPLSVWKWFHLADRSCLTNSLSVLADHAVAVDRAGCSNLANTQGLSAAALQLLVAALVPAGAQVAPAPAPEATRIVIKDPQSIICNSCWETTKLYGLPIGASLEPFTCGHCDSYECPVVGK